jgi:hypothetical protein
MKNVNVIVEEVKVLGRPVNPNSARQKRLAELEAKKANGGGKQGRPVNPNSERQARLKMQAINKVLGLGKQGRPVNPNSARQLRLAEAKAKAEANGGKVKRGRPALPKGDGSEVAA